jgi:hypothetical protein
VIGETVLFAAILKEKAKTILTLIRKLIRSQQLSNNNP